MFIDSGVRQRGVSMIELIIFIIVVGLALTGVLSVMNLTNRQSADPMLRKQALAVAESLLEEITLKDFADPDGTNAGETRATYDDVADYNGFSMAGITTVDGNPIAALAAYSAAVTVASCTLPGVPAADCLLVTVTVTDSAQQTVSLSAYRTNYAP
jgi:MSHA pilin protein MshD